MTVIKDAPLANYTRFGIGGPATVFYDTSEEAEFIDMLQEVLRSDTPHVVIGGGTNLVVSDAGFRGIVVRYTGRQIDCDGKKLRIEAGAVLQDLVDLSIAAGLKGLETMTGIPGYVGGAIYGNAGAYGHSINEVVRRVRFFDGEQIRSFTNEQCRFSYRESVFKERKDWVILSTDLELREGNAAELEKTAREIRAIRDAKYPPSMKCAGSIFKNLFVAELPSPVVAKIPRGAIRDGKVASAWFLEQAGVKGMRWGDIQVADYHANLIYNDGHGTARDLVAAITELKRRVHERWGFYLQEEVQYVGF
jgi:UDP-N-acetylmuramate dehydrogenase